MAGTVCELCEYDEAETNYLSKFDLFSLWLFENMNNDYLQVKDSLDYESRLKGNELVKLEAVTGDGGMKR